MTRRELMKLDAKLRRDLGLPEDTTVLLPCPPAGGFVVSLGAMTFEQTQAVLKAALAAGVDIRRSKR